MADVDEKAKAEKLAAAKAAAKKRVSISSPFAVANSKVRS